LSDIASTLVDDGKGLFLQGIELIFFVDYSVRKKSKIIHPPITSLQSECVSSSSQLSILRWKCVRAMSNLIDFIAPTLRDISVRWFFCLLEDMLEGFLGSKIFLVWVNYFVRYLQICLTKRH